MRNYFLLPALAIIFAIGMSFAHNEKEHDPSTDYILVDGKFEPIDMEVDCGSGDETCRAQFELDGPIYEVYNAANPNSLKEGDGEVKRFY